MFPALSLGGYSSLASRHSAKSSASLSSNTSTGTLSSLQSKDAERKSPQEQENGQILSPSPPRAPPREFAVSSGSNVSYQGEPAKTSGKLKGNSLDATRKRIAAMLGRKSWYYGRKLICVCDKISVYFKYFSTLYI